MFPTSFALALALATTADKPAPFPEGAVARLGGHTFHGPATDGFAFSPNGKHLHAPSPTGVYVWDADTGRRLPDLNCPPANTTGTAFSSVVAGGRIVRASAQKVRDRTPPEVLVGTLADGKQTQQHEVRTWLTFDPDWRAVQTVAVSADGTRLAFPRTDRRGTVVWDLTTNERVRTLASDARGHIDLSPTGDTLVTLDDQLLVWDVATGKDTAVFTRNSAYTAPRVSDGGKWVVSKFWRRPYFTNGHLSVQPGVNTVLLSDVAAGKEHKLDVGFFATDVRFVGTDEAILYGLRYATDGGVAGFVARWNLSTRKKGWETEYTVAVGLPRKDIWDRLQPAEREGRLAVSRDGKRVAVSNRGTTIAVFDAATGKRLVEPTAHETAVRAVGFSADGKTLWTVGDRDVRTWDVSTGGLTRADAPPELATGKLEVFTGGTAVLTRKAKDGTEVIGWDAAAGKVGWKFTAKMATVARPLSNDGNRVLLVGGVAGNPTDVCAVCDGATGKLEHEWPVNNPSWRQLPLVVSASGQRLWASADAGLADEDRTGLASCRLSDGGDATEVPVPANTRRRPGWSVERILAVAPDESAAVLLDADAAVWVATFGEKPKATRFVAGQMTPAAVLFAPDSKRVAMLEPQSSRVGVLDVTKPDGHRPQVFDRDGPPATAVAFSPDATRLAVGYAEGTAVVWKVK